MKSTRSILLSIIILILAAISYAFYVEFDLHIEPCPLCIAERVILASILIPSLVYLIHNPSKKIFKLIYVGAIAALSGFGAYVAAHHVWLTHLPPDQQPLSCGMPIHVMYSSLPLHHFLFKILSGDAECANTHWYIFNIGAPTLVLILFLLIFVLTLFTLKQKTNYR